jgi:hypothetical protein
MVYHFMYGPNYQAADPANSSIADGLDGLLPHLHARDVTLLLVSQAPDRQGLPGAGLARRRAIGFRPGSQGWAIGCPIDLSGYRSGRCLCWSALASVWAGCEA